MPPEPGPLPRKKIAVVGGGLSGITAALDLARSGRARVTLFEKAAEWGGLCAPVSIAGTAADRFYHVILPSDLATIGFLAGLGLDGEIDWRTSRAGFYGRGRLVPFASTADFLRFPFLPPGAKLRLGWGILRTARSAPPGGPDEPSAREWLERRFGRTVTEKFWDPLLRSKLGGARENTPASFMDATIKRLFGARRGAGGRERMGAVRGGYAPVLRAAEKALRDSGARLRLGVPVRSVAPAGGSLEIQTAEGAEAFDRVLLAVPLPEALRLAGAPAGDPAWDRFRRREYLGLVCLLLALRKPLSPYYLINLLDPDPPFTGVIESTNVLGPERFGGHHLVYLPKYVAAGDPAAGLPDDGVRNLFLSSLRRMFPNLAEEDILEAQVRRESFSLPLPAFGPPLQAGGFHSPVPGLYFCGTAFIEGATVNNDAALRAAAAAVEAVLKD
ncbi:MAG TPA: FAD-dependent oxidoreductase [Candidatus Aminicenantes bacterium]|nr:FAD-dependent oxidoreductase [Candidatus Aminicenantes bacterium]